MYKLKQIPEDFIVKELSSFTLGDGPYLYCRVRKREKNTLDAVREIAQSLGIKEKQIGFAGSKDKHAVTEQVMSFLNVPAEKMLSFPDVEVLGRAKNPLSLGDLEGNAFTITIRNLQDETIVPVEKGVNYFDEQRFGRHNLAIGRALVKGDIASAVSLIDVFSVISHLQQKPQDYVGALRTLPLRLLRLYVNAYQSYLWNEMVARFLKPGREVSYSQGMFVFPEKIPDVSLPLVGFATNVDAHPSVVREVLAEEGITPLDFVLRSLPMLSLEGEDRVVAVPVENVEIGKKQGDELTPGKQKVAVSFSLPKGSYATMVIRQMVR